jgi:hypothetical protein
MQIKTNQYIKENLKLLLIDPNRVYFYGVECRVILYIVEIRKTSIMEIEKGININSLVFR